MLDELYTAARFTRNPGKRDMVRAAAKVLAKQKCQFSLDGKNLF